jgi:hypothetical protein
LCFLIKKQHPGLENHSIITLRSLFISNPEEILSMLINSPIKALFDIILKQIFKTKNKVLKQATKNSQLS